MLLLMDFLLINYKIVLLATLLAVAFSKLCVSIKQPTNYLQHGHLTSDWVSRLLRARVLTR
jgi:hypothetical protein